MHFSIFEVIMLVCFGAGWPLSIAKAYRSRATGGKSLAFLAVIFTGYVAGILHKLTGHMDAVVWLYTLNAFMVAIDIGIHLRNLRYERTAEARAEAEAELKGQ